MIYIKQPTWKAFKLLREFIHEKIVNMLSDLSSF